MLSARQDSADKVDALDAGADDYVTKPFGMDELLARLRAAVRRATPADGADEPVVTAGRVAVDLARKKVTRDGADVRLTPTEWHLLEVLVCNRGRLVSQKQLLQEVWGPAYETETKLPARLHRPATPQTRGRPRPTPVPHHRAGHGISLRDLRWILRWILR